MTERDGLKALSEIMEPDVRNSAFVRINRETGEIKPIALEDHYAGVALYGLHAGVPDKVVIQFDVARNLYLYAWFEYCFYNVAEAKTLTVLEFSMRERIGEEKLDEYIKLRKRKHREQTGKGLSLSKGMKTLMEYCRDHCLVKNEGFSQWKRHAMQQAYNKAEAEQFKWAVDEMGRTGKGEIELPEINIKALPSDPNYDHVQHLIDHTNKIRNEYAHGSAMLYKPVLARFEMVSEFINQLYR